MVTVPAPDMLDVFCPNCRFNFFSVEGDPECSEPPSCDFARNEAPARVETLTRWLELHEKNPQEAPPAG